MGPWNWPSRKIWRFLFGCVVLLLEQSLSFFSFSPSPSFFLASRIFFHTCVITAAPIYLAQCSPLPLWSGFSIGRHRPYHFLRISMLTLLHTQNHGSWFHKLRKTLKYYQPQLQRWYAKLRHPHNLPMKDHAPVWEELPSTSSRSATTTFVQTEVQTTQTSLWWTTSPWTSLLCIIAHHSVCSKSCTHSLDLQPNHYLHLLPFARLLPPYSQQPTRTNQLLREPDHSCVIFSMKSDSHPNSTVKSTTQHLLTNMSIASPTALVLEDFLCM